jgi:FMN reductase (NADPH)/FMN reductase [NAD(P)H]
MNTTLEVIQNRKSVRAYLDKPIPEAEKEAIIQAALRSPTAGNMMLYSIIEANDQETKNKLVKTCDNQPFIARAPFVLLFLADYQRWYDYFVASGVPQICAEANTPMRKPEEGDLFLACCDALIAAQTAVLAAESMGIGSCYIGDIMENYADHKAMFNLPQYVFPLTLICFGYPTKQQQARQQTERFDKKYVVYQDRYKRLTPDDFTAMYQSRQAQIFKNRPALQGAENVGQWMYNRKFASEFSLEMSRSVRAILKSWSA